MATPDERPFCDECPVRAELAQRRAELVYVTHELWRVRTALRSYEQQERLALRNLDLALDGPG